MQSVVCFLVINKIRELPEISISSVLERTSANIIVGYLHQQDIQTLPQSSRIEFIDLNPMLEESEKDISNAAGSYIPFDREDFFDLVRIKWKLFAEVLCKYDALIYSDVDVIWLQDVHSSITQSFTELGDLEVLVQDASYRPGRTQLCMGMFACRASDFVREMIEVCNKLHAEGRAKKMRYSDDDAITEFYLSHPHGGKIMKLPQASFPVGNFLNLFLPFSLFRGLRPAPPYIFHANYVVGERRKLVLLKFIDFQFHRSSSKFLSFSMEYLLALKDFLVKFVRKPMSKFGQREQRVD